MYTLAVEAGKTVVVAGKGLKDGFISEHQDDLADAMETLEGQKDRKSE